MINPTTIYSADPEEDSAFQELLENHLPLVRSIVDRMKRKLPSNVETEDLMRQLGIEMPPWRDALRRYLEERQN